MKTILFLCTGNSCRSQMAEGLAKHYLSDTFKSYSAGIEKHGLNPYAVKAMKEIGIDITSHQSNTVDELEINDFDYVITVCGHADENCPFFPAKTLKVHKGFEDPPKLAANSKTEEEILSHYRKVRDEIHKYIIQLPDILHLSCKN